MKKSKLEVTLVASFGVIGLLLCVLASFLLLGFRFSPEHIDNYSYYADDESFTVGNYQFYSSFDIKGSLDYFAVPAFAIRDYGLFYRREQADTIYQLTTADGDSVAVLHAFEDDDTTHYFIGYTLILQEIGTDHTQDIAYANTVMPYFTDHIVLNGTEIELQKYCYFTSKEKITSLEWSGLQITLTKSEKFKQ